MIRILGQWLGVSRIAPEELKRLRKPIEKAILKAQLHYESSVKKKLTGPRTGRIYNLPGLRGRSGKARKIKTRDARGRFMARGTYQASAPGEAPALVTGKFRQSITHGPVVWEGDNASGEVGTSAKQAHIMEFGGIAGNNARILPRPYMAPTFLEQESRLVEILSEATKS